MTYPEGYLRYVALKRASGGKPATAIAKFASRYRFAGQIQTIVLGDFSAKPQEIYTLTLRISLAYSALEQLEKATGISNLPIKSVHLAQDIKKKPLQKFRAFLKDESSESLSKELDLLFERKNDTNLNPVVRAIRHSMFHGSLNPSRAGINNKAVVAFLEGLDKQLFTSMSTVFLAFVKGELETD